MAPTMPTALLPSAFHLRPGPSCDIANVEPGPSHPVMFLGVGRQKQQQQQQQLTGTIFLQIALCSLRKAIYTMPPRLCNPGFTMQWGMCDIGYTKPSTDEDMTTKKLRLAFCLSGAPPSDRPGALQKLSQSPPLC